MHARIIHTEYKQKRNALTNMKRESKKLYYNNYFEANKSKMSPIWKGIRSIVNLNNSSKKDIQIIERNGKNVSDPIMIFNEHYVNVGPNIVKKYLKSQRILESI